MPRFKPQKELADLERNSDEREARLARLEKAAEAWNEKQTAALASRGTTRDSE